MAKKMERKSGKTASKAKAGKVLSDSKSTKHGESVTVSALIHTLDKKKGK